MAQLVSAKGSDVLAWRAAGDFTATFRQVLLNRTEFYCSDEAAALLNSAAQALDNLAVENDAFCSCCFGLMDEVTGCAEPARLRELVTRFFAELYDHVSIHHSAPAFYQLSTLFLQALAGSVSRYADAKLGTSALQAPESALIAVGPAGHQEFTPFCPLQLLLVHGDVSNGDSDRIDRYADFLHEGFADCGLRIDGVVTPRNQLWRGTLTEWRQRLERILERGRSSEIIEARRLADQTQLSGAEEIGTSFRQLTQSLLSASSVARNNLVSRVTALSKGIGIMGGLRFEKSGPHRGMFALLENGLQPLSSSVSVLAVLKQLDTTATPARIRELLWRRELNVDLAERLLLAWHELHELCLMRERDAQPDWSSVVPLYLEINELGAAEQESLRGSLEAVGTIQRHISLTFSGMGG